MSQSVDQTVTVPDPEDQARANFYALLARLLHAPPDAALLRSIATSDDELQAAETDTSVTSASGEMASPLESPGSLEQTWRSLVLAAARASESDVSDEYDVLFVGSGRSEVSLYVGAYTARSSVDTNLVALREFLKSQGIERQRAVHEPEDHVAMLFEVMRFLISTQPGNIEQQESFFHGFVWSGGLALCDAICANERALFFKHVAAFAKSFLLIEHDAFKM
jgi:TorA maturation chaperone TorD